jgi:hypothetical protein
MLGQLGMMDPLQLRFTELCIEKRRMLNQINDVRVEAKSLSSEIHRLLDCYMELIDIDAFLADDDWSDGEFSEGEAAEAALSEYGFLGDSDEETLIEQDNLPYILFKEQQLKQAKSPKRKRSRSPRRQPQPKQTDPGKDGTSNTHGKPEYPIYVGRATNRISINCLGKLIEPPPLLAEEPLSGYTWHPRGFESKRKYIDCTQPPHSVMTAPKRVNYICRCELDGSFSISVEPTLVPIAYGSDPDNVWADFVGRFPISMQDSVRSEFSSLGAFFGLEHEATRKHLRLHAV